MRMIILYIHTLTMILNMVYLKMSLVAITYIAKSGMILSVIKIAMPIHNRTNKTSH